MATQSDTIVQYQTPEGVQLSLSLAGPMVRAVAWGIDFAIRVICYIILVSVLSMLGGLGIGMMFIALFLIEWFYPVIFEAYSGMTPGKMAMCIRVVHDDGTPVTWSSSLLRNLLRSVDFLPSFNICGFVSMSINSRFKRLGDIAAGTVVVYNTTRAQKIALPEGDPLPPPEPLKLEEQRLILDYCERKALISSSRSKELASILTEFTGPETPEKLLVAYGNWFLKGMSKNESNTI